MATLPAQGPFVVLTVYNSEPEHRLEFVTLIRDFANMQALVRPELCAFDIFTDEGERHIITLARWKDRTAFEEFKRSESGIRASELALVLKPTVYFLHPQATVEATAEPLLRVG